ncbi:WecB/TagA/CpsF family glycosyltransferase [Thioclava sp. FR2]|uniref:WecB/TagA/CpsF family glycosyltransferase n=1 Tax=Thioclava sp. FR2 TaxID=3445780 RepID=UPI003EBB1056
MQFRFPDQTITVNFSDREKLLAEVRRRFRAGHGFALGTINLDHLVKLRRSSAFRKLYAAQDLIVADGNPIVWLSRLAKKPVSLVPGSDLLRPILELAAKENMPVAFFGSQSEVLGKAAAKLTAEIPDLFVIWTQAPAMGFDPAGDDAKAALHLMRDKGVRLCILALTSPKQEAFAILGRELAPEIGFCCFGAGLDFVAGHQTRAPAWVRAIAMEWLWRALSSPRRLVPRYAACAAILPKEVIEAVQQRSH